MEDHIIKLDCHVILKTRIKRKKQLEKNKVKKKGNKGTKKLRKGKEERKEIAKRKRNK